MPDAVAYLTDLPSAADLVIVGGGIVGAATAFYAARAGFHPLLLERRPRLCTLTTPAATGAFRLQFDNREELEMVRHSVDLLLHFAEMTGQRTYDARIQQQGYLFVTTEPDRAEWQRRLVEQQHGWGQRDIEILNGDEVRYRFPFVADEVIQARFRPGDGFLDQKRVTMGLAAGSGAGVVTNCAVTGFRVQGGRLMGVETERGMVATDRAVIAAGPFSGTVTELAGCDLPVAIVPRQKMVMPDVPEVPVSAPMMVDDDSGSHWRPALQGAYLLFTDPATPPGPPTENPPLDYRFPFRVLDPGSWVSVGRTTPLWREVWERGAASWVLHGGQYTVTPDHKPLIGPTSVEGLYVNTGYSGHGVMGSPGGSKLLAELLTGNRSSGDNPFKLDRQFVARELDVL